MSLSENVDEDGIKQLLGMIKFRKQIGRTKLVQAGKMNIIFVEKLG